MEHFIEVAGATIDTRNFINGERVATGDTFANHSPIDGTFLGDFHQAGEAEVNAAVDAARAAFPAWAAMGPAKRGELLHKLADLVEANIETLAMIETMDNGSLLRSHIRGVMPRVAMNIRFFADWAINKLHHPAFETRGHSNNISWDPSGVVALITPWNAPLMLATWKIGPALAAGDTVVLKPAEWTPLSASYFADLTVQAGIPAGVLNVVHGYGSEVGHMVVNRRGRLCRCGSRGCWETEIGDDAVAAALAITGRISPLLAAVLMPVSSLSVLAIAVGVPTFRRASPRGSPCR